MSPRSELEGVSEQTLLLALDATRLSQVSNGGDASTDATEYRHSYRVERIAGSAVASRYRGCVGLDVMPVGITHNWIFCCKQVTRMRALQPGLRTQRTQRDKYTATGRNTNRISSIGDDSEDDDQDEDAYSAKTKSVDRGELGLDDLLRLVVGHNYR